MREIIAVPYSIDEPTNSSMVMENIIRDYPIKQNLFDSSMEKNWTDVYVEESDFDSKKKDIFKKCNEFSRIYSERIVIGGDHSLTYPFLKDDDIEQLILIDHHTDGAIYSERINIHHSENVNCGSWGYWLARDRPDIKYMILSHPSKRNPKYIPLFTKDPLDKVLYLSDFCPGWKITEIPTYSNFGVDYESVSLEDLVRELDSVVEDKPTAVSVCADSSKVFKSKYESDPQIIEIDGLIDLMKYINDKTDLNHIDLMEINLENNESVEAGKKFINSMKRF